MKKEKSFLILLFTLVIASSVINLFHLIKEHQHQTGFVRMNQIWEDLEMRKELEIQLEEKSRSIQSDLAYLEGQLNQKARKGESSKEYQQLQNAYLFKKSQFENEYDELAAKLNEQIDMQLRAYIKEFAQLNEFSYIHVLDPSSSLLYASDDQDITEEVTLYVNMKYQGLK
ncbi:MAG TPA: hypothetical protein DDX92_07155 [Flavobacteriales bacterium]|jgi:Skp family chaperone for outer membrane proteins|nr:hypothetical protein [Flavobacteriales bacterium]